MAQTFEEVLDPNETRDFGVDWSAQLGATKTISTSSWAVASGTVSILTDTKDTTTTTVRVTGGTIGENAELVNTITLSSGEEFEQTCILFVRSR